MQDDALELIGYCNDLLKKAGTDCSAWKGNPLLGGTCFIRQVVNRQILEAGSDRNMIDKPPLHSWCDSFRSTAAIERFPVILLLLTPF